MNGNLMWASGGGGANFTYDKTFHGGGGHGVSMHDPITATFGGAFSGRDRGGGSNLSGDGSMCSMNSTTASMGSELSWRSPVSDALPWQSNGDPGIDTVGFISGFTDAVPTGGHRGNHEGWGSIGGGSGTRGSGDGGRMSMMSLSKARVVNNGLDFEAVPLPPRGGGANLGAGTVYLSVISMPYFWHWGFKNFRFFTICGECACICVFVSVTACIVSF